MRSWIGYLSPYVRSLEERVDTLNTEREALQNRLLHAYSGYELRQSVPSYSEAQESASTKSPMGDSVIGTGIHSTENILKKLEDAGWAEATGIPGMTTDAAMQQAQEEFENNAREYEERLIKAKNKAAADSGMPPV